MKLVQSTGTQLEPRPFKYIVAISSWLNMVER